MMAQASTWASVECCANNSSVSCGERGRWQGAANRVLTATSTDRLDFSNYPTLPTVVPTGSHRPWSPSAARRNEQPGKSATLLQDAIFALTSPFPRPHNLYSAPSYL